MERGIRKLFSTISETYERVNRVLTFGFDRAWRRKAAGIGAAGGGRNWLDVCSGTGETAVCLKRLAPDGTNVLSLDFCPPMLEKAVAKREAGSILFTIADASLLPFRDGSLDLITISFATRNLNVNRESLIACLREFCRVLAPGGRFVNLETSQPPSPILRTLFHSYVRTVVRPVGRAISGSDSAYVYLSHTIPRFYRASELSGLITDAGFTRVSVRALLGGVAAIHHAVKE